MGGGQLGGGPGGPIFVFLGLFLAILGLFLAIFDCFLWFLGTSLLSLFLDCLIVLLASGP